MYNYRSLSFERGNWTKKIERISKQVAILFRSHIVAMRGLVRTALLRVPISNGFWVEDYIWVIYFDISFSAKNWDEFIGQLQHKFKLTEPVMKNYRFDYQVKDNNGKLSPECYGLTEDDEFQYALSGIG